MNSKIAVTHNELLENKLGEFAKQFTTLVEKDFSRIEEHQKSLQHGAFRHMINNLNIIQEIARTIDLMQFQAIIHKCQALRLPTNPGIKPSQHTVHP